MRTSLYQQKQSNNYMGSSLPKLLECVWRYNQSIWYLPRNTTVTGDLPVADVYEDQIHTVIAGEIEGGQDEVYAFIRRGIDRIPSL